jgi:hypothetical protein
MVSIGNVAIQESLGPDCAHDARIAMPVLDCLPTDGRALSAQA